MQPKNLVKMMGAFNKFKRKIAAKKGKDEFESRLIKATHNDMKEAKEKHVLFIIDVLKGKYTSMVSHHKGLEKLFDTLQINVHNFTVMVKILSILHRCLKDD